jgi:hypothetical protein
MLRSNQGLFWVCAVIFLAACSGDDGKRGEDGADGMDGMMGDEGPKGDDGAKGDPGEPGPKGDDGAKGDPGEQGPAGDPGRNGDDGRSGKMGSQGEPGPASLVTQTNLGAGDMDCFNGGVRIDSGVDEDGSGTLDAEEIDESAFVCTPTVPRADKSFNRIATFLPCTQIDPACDDDTPTVAEIVTASEDGMTLIYSDAANEAIGFVDISDPAAPVADGTVAMAGEPTSVSVAGNFVLVGVNTSPDFMDPSGELEVINVNTMASAATIDLGGQPDSIAVSPDGSYAAVVIENERDEDLGEGGLPQLPAGKLVVVDLSGAPSTWTTTDVDLTGLDGAVEPTDPEPEFVDINSDNVAVVTLQENNAIAIVDLATATVMNSFSAGTVDLTQIDATEEDAWISQTESLSDVPREPDGVTWLSTEYFVTADEGDWNGGSRGFTVFNTMGDVVWGAGNTLDHLTARLGHYPDGRSENKGNEPENAEFGVYGSERYLFVNSERSSLVFVYDVADFTKPAFKQALPAALGPEGALAVPSRNLFVVASEEDERGAFRSGLNIYSYTTAPPQYPTLMSSDRLDGTPIPWAAMSGLGAHPTRSDILYAVEDSFFLANRIFEIDTSDHPARIVREIVIRDDNDVLAAFPTVDVDDALEADDPARNTVFDDVDLAAMINSDKSVNIDPEGIVVASDGGFWVVSEGSGTISEPLDRPLNTLNFLFKIDEDGVIEDVATPPAAVNDYQLRFGFEGVTEYDGGVYVAFQRHWEDIPAEPAGQVRIGRYDIVAGTWDFSFYELDAVASANGGWVGLSDITSLGGGEFLVLERDNQIGPDAVIKRLYKIDLSGHPATVLAGGKELVRDLVPDFTALGGQMPEKVEGSTVAADGNVWVINDNDGIDDNSGETQLLNLGGIL